MTLLWKLLRKHISISQILGFSVANLIGMFIILLSIQVYEDISPLFSPKGNPFASDYLVVSKKVSTVGSIFGSKDKIHFTPQEIDEIKQQEFVESVAAFTASRYKVGCYISIAGTPTIGTDMFFESVPNDYVDVDPEKWMWSDEEDEVPIVLPRSYLTIYNFGFAPTRSLPKLDEKTISRIGLSLLIRGNGLTDRLKGRVVGFTDKLNTILVPESFMLWSNAKYAPSESTSPSRLILTASNPADERIAGFMAERDYDIESDKLKSSKSTYFLRIAAGIILGIGLLITLLSLYVLALSVYLLIEKNSYKLQNLMLIGYTRWQVAIPYQMLAIGTNAVVLTIAYLLMLMLREEYMQMLGNVFPDASQANTSTTLILAIATFLAVSSLNMVIIYKKIKNK